MESENIKTKIEEMKKVVEPWYQSLMDPAMAQENTLKRLLARYNKTEYGKNHKSESIGSYADYKKAFPISTFLDFKPHIDQVLAGNTYALLAEEPEAVARTKGTTGEPKFYPFTLSRIKLYLDLAKRVEYSYVLSKSYFEWMSGYRLNLNPSPKIKTLMVGTKELNLGYAPGIDWRYADSHEKLGPRALLSDEELDLLPQESSKSSWEARYELAFRKTEIKNIVAMRGMPSVVDGFSRYLYREHHIYPKDIFQMKLLDSGGYPSIHSKLFPVTHDYYGKSCVVRDMYVSTESVFGTQLDDKKAWAPFYDLIFFEVQTIHGIKQLHEMLPGEIGSLVVSTFDLPRYANGDLILAFDPPYFRCIGRENTQLQAYNFCKLYGKSFISIPKHKLTLYK
jgi:hypothetical protein